MNKISFIHLSDIHFVKTSGKPADIDKELRDLIIVDIENNAKKQIKDFAGILLCGDIAFSGQEKEYKIAFEFLQKLTAILDIKASSVYCVPGNHDVDQSVSSKRKVIYDLQNKIDSKATLDEADAEFARTVEDEECSTFLFEPLKNYNDFAALYSCDISAENPIWETYFELEHDMKLKLYGMNSCLISNIDDYNVQNDKRLMYVGQNQIPKYEKDVVCMSLCHHPPECWKFKDDMLHRISQRADIQMYGHMHEQSMLYDKENLVLFSGATHPTRGNDWIPRYNWITVECVLLEEKRLIRIIVYPRILTKQRNRFAPDIEYCDGKLYFEHFIEIDKKVYNQFSDDQYMRCEEQSINSKNEKRIIIEDTVQEVNYRDLAFTFCKMSISQQHKILNELNLLDIGYVGEEHGRHFKEILLAAKQKQVDKVLVEKIMKQRK